MPASRMRILAVPLYTAPDISGTATCFWASLYEISRQPALPLPTQLALVLRRVGPLNHVVSLQCFGVSIMKLNSHVIEIELVILQFCWCIRLGLALAAAAIRAAAASIAMIRP